MHHWQLTRESQFEEAAIGPMHHHPHRHTTALPTRATPLEHQLETPCRPTPVPAHSQSSKSSRHRRCFKSAQTPTSHCSIGSSLTRQTPSRRARCQSRLTDSHHHLNAQSKIAERISRDIHNTHQRSALAINPHAEQSDYKKPKVIYRYQFRMTPKQSSTLTKEIHCIHRIQNSIDPWLFNQAMDKASAFVISRVAK